MTTFCPHASVIFWVPRRPVMSVGPPAGSGRIIFNGFEGYVGCACTEDAERNNAIATTHAVRFIVLLGLNAAGFRIRVPRTSGMTNVFVMPDLIRHPVALNVTGFRIASRSRAVRNNEASCARGNRRVARGFPRPQRATRAPSLQLAAERFHQVADPLRLLAAERIELAA
jgi:hypothetical protein